MAEQGDSYAKFIEGDLKQEYDRRTGLDARGLAIITSSSAFLTLIFAITVLVAGKEHHFSPTGARGLVCSLVLFVVASVLGLLANASRRYQVPSGETLLHMTTDHWTDSETAARNICAGLNVTTVRSLRVGNGKKARLLAVGFGFQLAALLALVVALAGELRKVVF